MPTTTNFGWTTPADTDLVKDGAAAIRTLAGNIDTSLVDLKGGTTGQVLAKNSNTDLDFIWSADAAGISPTIFDAKGDIIAATAADTASRLGVGANNTVLTADSTTDTGLKWATPIAAGANYTLLNTGGTSLTAADTITVSGISGANKIMVRVTNASAGALSNFTIRFNSNTSSIYSRFGGGITADGSYLANIFFNNGNTGTSFPFGQQANAASGIVSGGILLDGCNSSGVKIATVLQGANNADVNTQTHNYYQGIFDSSSTISSVSIISSNGNFDAGTIYVYTSA